MFYARHVSFFSIFALSGCFSNPTVETRFDKGDADQGVTLDTENDDRSPDVSPEDTSVDSMRDLLPDSPPSTALILGVETHSIEIREATFEVFVMTETDNVVPFVSLSHPAGGFAEFAVSVEPTEGGFLVKRSESAIGYVGVIITFVRFNPNLTQVTSESFVVDAPDQVNVGEQLDRNSTFVVFYARVDGSTQTSPDLIARFEDSSITISPNRESRSTFIGTAYVVQSLDGGFRVNHDSVEMDEDDVVVSELVAEPNNLVLWSQNSSFNDPAETSIICLPRVGRIRCERSFGFEDVVVNIQQIVLDMPITHHKFEIPQDVLVPADVTSEFAIIGSLGLSGRILSDSNRFAGSFAGVIIESGFISLRHNQSPDELSTAAVQSVRFR